MAAAIVCTGEFMWSLSRWRLDNYLSLPLAWYRQGNAQEIDYRRTFRVAALEVRLPIPPTAEHRSGEPRDRADT